MGVRVAGEIDRFFTDPPYFKIMSDLRAVIAAHPLRKKPYNAIKFVRVDGWGTPLYRIAKLDREVGAAEALRIAFELFGAHCFHCKIWMPPQPLSVACTRDHLRPKKNGGTNYLHNLVFSCGSCNRNKGGSDLISFNVERGAEYLDALEAQIVRCLSLMRAD